MRAVLKAEKMAVDWADSRVVHWAEHWAFLTADQSGPKMAVPMAALTVVWRVALLVVSRVVRKAGDSVGPKVVL